MEANKLGFVCLILTGLTSVGRSQISNCNLETDMFSHEVKMGILSCSDDFHKKLQAYYPTAEQFMASVEIQPPRSITAPRSMKYSSMGTSIYFSNTTNWIDICQLWVGAAECLEPAINGCDIAVSFKLLQDRLHAYEWTDLSRPEYLAPEYAFSERTCQSGRVRPDLQRDIENPDLDLKCLSQDERLQFKQCISPLIAEVKAHKMRTLYTTEKDKMVLDSMSGSTLRCIRNLLDMSSCNAVSQRIWLHIGQLNLPSFFVNPPNVSLPSNYDFSGAQRCTVGVYGDPHFRFCSRPKLVTCSLPGEHIYISNHFVEIRATNSKVQTTGMLNLSPTAVSQVRITFKSISTSRPIGLYLAADGNLPTKFMGHETVSIGTGDDAVTISTDGNKRTIIQKSSGLIVVIRKWGDYYMFTMRMAEDIVQDSYGVLVTGCTMLQSINTNGWIRNHRFRRKRSTIVDECTNYCRSIPEDMGLRIACIFDCGVTGDRMFVNMSMDAWNDMVAIENEDTRLKALAKSKWERRRPAALARSDGLCNSSSFLHILLLLIPFFKNIFDFV